MSAIARALSVQDAVDVAAFYAGGATGLGPISGEGLPESGRSLRQTDPTLRLVFVGDPTRGIPPCAACHGPQAQKLGAPSLHGQQAAYLERQLAAFNEGIRQNDINQQMRAIAVQLTPAEMHALAAYYGGANGIPAAEK
ncbi:MAG: c-type cytochrome [Alphaproteobacteria bacterium]|nr:c-type cytochrome [Alphaproteobacteria bacterium]